MGLGPHLWRELGGSLDFLENIYYYYFISIYSDVFTGVSEVNRYDYCSTLAFSPVFCRCLLRSFVRDMVFIELLLHGALWRYTGAIQALCRHYAGAIQARYRRYTGTMQALCRRYTGAIQALHRRYAGAMQV